MTERRASGVDVRLRHEVLHLLDDLNAGGLAIVLTTHDLNGIAAHLPRVVCLNRSVIGDGSPHDVLTSDVLERTYGASMQVLEHGGMPVVVDSSGARTSAPCGEPPVIDELLRPFDFEFFRNGLLVATMAGALCGAIGVYVVLKGMSYIGHGLSHAIFGGFAASSLLGVNFLLGAGAWGVASALMINAVTRRRVIGSDAAIGVITTASFALGLALFALFGGVGAASRRAFGSILGFCTEDSVLSSSSPSVRVGYSALPGAAFHNLRPEGRVAAYTARNDALDGRARGLVLSTMQVLGVTLIAAALVIPAAVARMLTNRRALWPLDDHRSLCGFVGINLTTPRVQSGPTSCSPPRRSSRGLRPSPARRTRRGPASRRPLRSG